MSRLKQHILSWIFLLILLSTGNMLWGQGNCAQNAGANFAVCASDTIQLNGSVTPRQNFITPSGKWNNGGGTFIPNRTTLNARYIPSASEIANGSVTLQLENTSPGYWLVPGIVFISGCSGTDNITITINPGPTPNAGNDTTICAGFNRVYLNGSVSSGTASWVGGNGTFIPNRNSLTAWYIPTSAEVAAGSVKLALSSASGCTSGTDTITITINSAPVPNITGPLLICEQSAGNVYTTPASSGHTYDWHLVGGNIVGGQGTNSITVDWGSAGPGYLYVIQTSSDGCAAVGSINTISRFDFNTSDLEHATVGPDAVGYDSDAQSDGLGFRLAQNTGGTKGIDLEIPGSVYDRGKMCMSFSWQKDENDAEFFKRGNNKFYIQGGILRISIEVKDGAGTTTQITQSTGYTVPNDDIFRHFTFCYDSASGVARVLVQDSLVWQFNGSENRSLNWIGSGNALIGTIMDGSGSGNTLIDWANIAIPVSISPKPDAFITGPSPVCQNSSANYYTDTPAYTTHFWSVTGGSIVSGQGTPYINILWNTAGTRSITLTQSDTLNGCDSTYIKSVTVTAAPTATISGEDTLCKDEQQTYQAANITGSNIEYSWTSGIGTLISATDLDSLIVLWDTVGQTVLSLTLTDTVVGCTSQTDTTITIAPYPSANFTGDTVVCQDETFSYQADCGTCQYTWTADNATISGSTTGQEISVYYPNAGSAEITLQLTNPPFQCLSEYSQIITIRAKPVTQGIFR